MLCSGIFLLYEGLFALWIEKLTPACRLSVQCEIWSENSFGRSHISQSIKSLQVLHKLNSLIHNWPSCSINTSWVIKIWSSANRNHILPTVCASTTCALVIDRMSKECDLQRYIQLEMQESVCQNHYHEIFKEGFYGNDQNLPMGSVCVKWSMKSLFPRYVVICKMKNTKAHKSRKVNLPPFRNWKISKNRTVLGSNHGLRWKVEGRRPQLSVRGCDLKTDKRSSQEGSELDCHEFLILFEISSCNQCEIDTNLMTWLSGWHVRGKKNLWAQT